MTTRENTKWQASNRELTRQPRTRRGILAAAGLALAALAARQAVGSEPVAADGQTWTLPYNGTAPSDSPLINLINTGAGIAVFGNSGSGTGIYGSSSGGSGTAGVFGYSGGNYGVQGSSPNGYGVYGLSQQGGSGLGVYGISYGNHAIWGNLFAPAGSGAAGVYGLGNGSGTYGVLGNGLGGVGVQGISGPGIGVVGTSTSDSGVIGGSQSATAGKAGGYFYNTAINGSGVVGQVFAASGAAAFVGAASASNYAAFFTGPVVINGTLAVSGAKSAVVKHADGSHRLVYCEESPESYFTDYGKATLVNGKAEVKLDADFAQLIHTEDYHVFLTAYGDSKGLYVTNQSVGGFAVREQQGGVSGLGFSWRVVGKRKDIGGERLAKFVMPTIALATAPPPLPTPPAPLKKPAPTNTAEPKQP